ncbi:MAG: carbohydrate kinase [Desulfobulbaceae bacterium BRH_c16a]|nr:MAG: carbohydrate kinase [Desulfobulbaceae bacterium BRH_c16a]KJS02271.1 MAG: carbohydrate kinase [Desulfobulbaceae bacterium BRH_c16a]
MKNIIVSGSLAYDRIMNFSEKFSDHILPDKIHSLNVCFQVNGVTENYGGTAGNIGYALKLMGENPVISATIGSDHHKYFEWLEKNDIAKDGIKVIPEELTAGAYITTDMANNQITGFNPGAMKFSSGLDIESLDPQNSLLLVSPGNLDDMVNYPRRCKKVGIDYIFDPGQALPMLQPDDLREVITDCMLLIVNDYEFNLIQDKTGLTNGELLGLAKKTIVTLGEAGSKIYTQGRNMTIPSFKAKRVVDPTGAGDAYRGGLLSGLVQGADLETSAIRGSVCASFAVECNGTQVYSFTSEEFSRRMETKQL